MQLDGPPLGMALGGAAALAAAALAIAAYARNGGELRCGRTVTAQNGKRLPSCACIAILRAG